MDNSEHSQISEWDALEARSLMSAAQNGPDEKYTSPQQKKSQAFLRRNICIVVVMAICAVVSLFKEDIVAMMVYDHEVVVHGKLPVEELRTLALEGKREFDEMVKKEYGEYAEQVFDTVSVLKYFKTPYDVAKEDQKPAEGDLSRERLKRRMKIKIIESQIEEGNTKFTFVVAGHSACAGHGNLFKHSYGNVIEQSLKGAFGSLGIQFYSKNYAAGNTKSSPENALCMQANYGKDIDVLSWDFGMTDGRTPQFYKMWKQRAALHPTRPILFSYGQRYCDQMHKEHEEQGGAGFEANFWNARTIFPNSDDPNVDTSKLSPAVKNYMCNGHPETGDVCGTNDVKYDTKEACGNNIKGQVSWHNGWKDHLFIGRVTAAFILENFLQALEELAEAATVIDEGDGKTPKHQTAINSLYLAELRRFEREDHEKFEASMTPDDSEIFGAGLKHGGNFTNFQRKLGYCRHTFLPNEARYNGVVFDGKQEPAEYMFGGKHDYKDEGHDLSKLPDPEPDNDDSEVMLVYNVKGDRGTCKEAEIDMKDAYMIRYEDKWMKMTLPNSAEVQYYNLDTNDLDGVILMCTTVKFFGKRAAGEVIIPDMFNSTLIPNPDEAGIFVNGVRVIDGARVEDDRCYVLKHKEGEEGYFFPKNSAGRYEFKFRLPIPGKMQLTTIVIV